MHFTMPDMASAVFWIALGKIILANIILSGDNAVVIAMACRNLSEKHRRPAIMAGSAGAIVLRVIFVFMIAWLMNIPYLKLVGGLLLLWIGVKLLNENEGEGDGVKASASLSGAIWTIIVADAVMSLDNAIAIAVAAKNDGVLIIAGLLISIPIIIFGSTLLTTVLQRYPILVILGGGLLGWLGGEIIAGDGRKVFFENGGKREVLMPGTIASWLEANVPHAEHVCGVVGVLVVVGLGLWLRRRTTARELAHKHESVDLAAKKH